jgi:hypothetical protein
MTSRKIRRDEEESEITEEDDISSGLEFSEEESEIELTARSETVYLAHLQKEELLKCTSPILRILLYSTQKDAPTRFFSFTEHDQKISLIVDEASVPWFTQEGFHVFPEPWNVIQLDLGSSGIPSEAGIVSMVGSLLGLKEIGVYYLSTAQHDFVLVQQKNLQAAMRWLQENFRRKKSKYNPILPILSPKKPEGDNSSSTSTMYNNTKSEEKGKKQEKEEKNIKMNKNKQVDKETANENSSNITTTNLNSINTPTTPTPIPTNSKPIITPLSLSSTSRDISGGYAPCLSPSSPPSRSPDLSSLITLSTELHLASTEQIARCTRPLLKLIFFENAESRFFSFTYADDEISLLCDEKHLALFPDNCLARTHIIWKPMKRWRKAGFFETGVVSFLTAPLAQAGVTVLYVSAYHTSFILVPTTEYETALATFKKNDFQLLDDTTTKDPKPDSPQSDPSNTRHNSQFDQGNSVNN